ncbi:hypothetical protein [Endozoicomonas sp. Mp262]|uniref:hypothetical protein n=1 Tax=Endozoicomonas sp. Mp262 TaxID=2919499 RepID=UPI0021E05AE1
MLKKIRNASDKTPPVTLTLTARQIAAIVEALGELKLIVRFSYNQLSAEDKRCAKQALNEARRSKALNALEWAQFQQEGEY